MSNIQEKTSWDAFQTAYKRAPSHVQNLIDSEIIPKLIEGMYSDAEIETDIVLCTKLITHFALNNIFETELKDALQIPEEIIDPVINELTAIIRNKNAAGELKEELKLKPDASEIKPEIVQPLTREDIVSVLASKRTMNSDIDALHEHTDDTQK